MSKLSMASQMAGIAGHVMREKITRPMATAASDVPRGPDAITKEWLTAVLCDGTAGAEVTAFNFADRHKGSTSRGRIELTYNDAGSAAGLPPSVWFKSTPSFTTRLVSGLTRASQNEGRFYTQVRPGLGVRSPEGYHGSADEQSRASMVLIEDIGRTRDAFFGGPAERYVTREMAEDMTREHAAYHGALWQSERFKGDLSWVPTSLEWQTWVNDVMPFERRTLIGVDRAADVSAAGFLARKDDIWPAFMRSLEMNVSGPMTFLHQDQHAGNWFSAPGDQMGLYDWQCVARGGWALDVAYAYMSNLTIDDRRNWERDLIELYLQRLGEAGCQPPTFDEAWLQYRQQTFHGLAFWLITIGAGKLQPDMQPVEVSRANLERMTQAVMDLESFDAIDQR